ncbi:hypothetical protein BDC45DRAFT_503080 [Circinella umbellata]|nr:hypothetical protein BDC45DRAFT_503080 [Circinella umbellata]
MTITTRIMLLLLAAFLCTSLLLPQLLLFHLEKRLKKGRLRNIPSHQNMRNSSNHKEAINKSVCCPNHTLGFHQVSRTDRRVIGLVQNMAFTTELASMLRSTSSTT